MATDPSAASKTMAGVRMATSLFFLLFGEYKLAGPGFAHGGFQGYLRDYIATSAVSFYRPVLSGIIQPHAVFFGYLVGAIEMFVGVCLLLGLWVRVASAVGIFFLLNLTLPGGMWGTAHRYGATSVPGSIPCHSCCCLSFFMLRMPEACGDWMVGENNADRLRIAGTFSIAKEQEKS